MRGAGDILPPDAGPEEVCARFGVSRESRARLELYAAELARWQRRINLVGPETLRHVWTRHIADSLQLLDHLPEGTRRIVDLGAGGGAPGLVAALALGEEAGPRVMLVERSGKKAAFLRSVAQKAQVRVMIRHQRIEDLDPEAEGFGPADLVTARALAPMAKLLALALPMLERGARGVFFKGQDVERELTEATRYWHIVHEIVPSVTDAGGVLVKIREVRGV